MGDYDTEDGCHHGLTHGCMPCLADAMERRAVSAEIERDAAIERADSLERLLNKAQEWGCLEWKWDDGDVQMTSAMYRERDRLRAVVEAAESVCRARADVSDDYRAHQMMALGAALDAVTEEEASDGE